MEPRTIEVISRLDGPKDTAFQQHLAAIGHQTTADFRPVVQHIDRLDPESDAGGVTELTPIVMSGQFSSSPVSTTGPHPSQIEAEVPEFSQADVAALSAALDGLPD